MFTLCIATMDRFDSFLSRYIPKYLENPLIYKIIITDENGHDADKIYHAPFYNGSKDKLIIAVNDKRLGPLENKYKCMRIASSLPSFSSTPLTDGGEVEEKVKPIAIIDSDNFAPLSYFEAAKKFLEGKEGLGKDFVLLPSFAKPNFSLKKFIGEVKLDAFNPEYDLLFNVGNCILSPSIVNKIRLEGEPLLPYCSSYDVILWNTMILEQMPTTKYFVVSGMEYEHTVHNGSIYLQTHEGQKAYKAKAMERFANLFWNPLSSSDFYCKNKDTYPPFKKGDYLEEAFFHLYGKTYPHPPKEKRKYIPAFWTNFQIESWFSSCHPTKGKRKGMNDMLQNWIKTHPSPYGYFTVVQYDDGTLLSLPPNTKVFGACSGTDPIPLIYEDQNHTLENLPKLPYREKNILCSFVGSMTSNNVQPNVRMEMKKTLEGKEGFQLFFSQGWTPTVGKNSQDLFMDKTMHSKFALAPRGYGRSSFRFFEILQMGSIPIYIWNDKNWLPFQDKIKYSEISIVVHVKQLGALEEKLKSITEEKYNQMIENYQKYKHYFTMEGMFEEIMRRV